MAYNSGIFPSNNFDRKYTTLQLATFRMGMFSTGVYPGYLNEMQVAKAALMMNSFIKPGGAIIQGYTFDNNSNTLIAHSAADPTNPRIDLIVLRLDLTARSIDPIILNGTPASSPIAPTLTQNESIYEYPLASVLIPAGVTTLDTATYTDLRTYAVANTAAQLLVTGTYIGDGAASRFIDLGFTPLAVFISPQMGKLSTSDGVAGGFVINGYPLKNTGNYGVVNNVIEIVEGGFNVFYCSVDGGGGCFTNSSSGNYSYIAFR